MRTKTTLPVARDARVSITKAGSLTARETEEEVVLNLAVPEVTTCQRLRLEESLAAKSAVERLKLVRAVVPTYL